MESEKEIFFQCPYCWQQISMIFEIRQAMIDYIEDCEVCCRPISIDYQPSDVGERSLVTSRLDD